MSSGGRVDQVWTQQNVALMQGYIYTVNLCDAYSDAWHVLHAGDGRWFDMQWAHFAAHRGLRTYGKHKEGNPSCNQ